MNTLFFKKVCLFVLVCLFTATSPLMAQDENPTEKAPKAKKVKVAKNGNSAAAIMAQVSGMNREEKNTMSVCPLHNKHMSLSDNYRADASDYVPGDGYPFAYQLNYRRHCSKCTKVMSKEVPEVKMEEIASNTGKVNIERCEVHNNELKSNPDLDKVEYEKNPASDMPHAKQYLLKNYCKVCTKVYKIHNE